MSSPLNPPKPAPTALVIALGDPAGIGAEVTLKALAQQRPSRQHVELVGCRRWLEDTYMLLRERSNEPLADPAAFTIIDVPLDARVTPGCSDAAAGAAGFHWLTRAVERVMTGGGALITAPIAKANWHAAGFHYPGQTERLAELAGVTEASMLFTARAPHGRWRFNTLLATTHIPLAAVPSTLSASLVERKLDVLLTFCRRFQPQPRLMVAGLNPHAGEAGNLGVEERDWLEPALESWRQRNPCVTLRGPLPPDSCWLEAGDAWQGRSEGPDGFLALYHDQGLIPVKLLAFDAAVNTSLGLPFLRTSPDHGTGFDIAGQGVARACSMAAAIEAAWELGGWAAGGTEVSSV